MPHFYMCQRATRIVWVFVQLAAYAFIMLVLGKFLLKIHLFEYLFLEFKMDVFNI